MTVDVKVHRSHKSTSTRKWRTLWRATSTIEESVSFLFEGSKPSTFTRKFVGTGLSFTEKAALARATKSVKDKYLKEAPMSTNYRDYLPPRPRLRALDKRRVR